MVLVRVINSGQPSGIAPELFNIAARVQAASYGELWRQDTKEALDAQRPQIRLLWGVARQVGGAQLHRVVHQMHLLGRPEEPGHGL